MSGRVVDLDNLPTSAGTLTDDTTTPIVPGVGAYMMGYDGTTWDMARLAKLFELDTNYPTTSQLVLGVNLRTGGAGGSVEIGTSSSPIYNRHISVATYTQPANSGDYQPIWAFPFVYNTASGQWYYQVAAASGTQELTTGSGLPANSCFGKYDSTRQAASTTNIWRSLACTQYGALDANLRDASGNEVGLTGTPIYVAPGTDWKDSTTKSWKIIDYAHHEIHDGDHFFYTDYDSDVDTAAPKYYRLTTPNTTKWVHMLLTLYSEGVGTWELYENPTVNAAGTTATTYNNNRNSATAAGLVVAYDPTSTADGTLLKIWRTGSGTTAPSRIGGESSRDTEIILKQNEDYFLKFTPDADNAKTKIELEWYEHTNS